MSLKIAFMGDSISEGQYVDPSKIWTALIEKKINIFASNLIRKEKLIFFNRGVSNETTRQGLERFPRDIQGLRPDIMTLQFGLNDCNCWDTDCGLPRVSKLAYKANLIEMITRARKFGVAHIILSTNHTTLRHDKLSCGQTLEECRIEYNLIVREVAKKTKVILCDMEKAFENLSTEQLRIMLLKEPDLLHLSETGHEKYCSVIYPFIEEAVKMNIVKKKK